MKTTMLMLVTLLTLPAWAQEAREADPVEDAWHKLHMFSGDDLTTETHLQSHGIAMTTGDVEKLRAYVAKADEELVKLTDEWVAKVCADRDFYANDQEAFVAAWADLDAATRTLMEKTIDGLDSAGVDSNSFRQFAAHEDKATIVDSGVAERIRAGGTAGYLQRMCGGAK